MAPEWFTEALDDAPESRVTRVEGADIHYLHWPNPGAPGLILQHGHAAHAHWWDFIAPALHRDYEIIAVDQSGSGDSDHRDTYTPAVMAQEILACSEDAGLTRPHLTGHSFGGTIARIAAWLHPEAFSSLVIVDSLITGSRGNRQPPPMPRKRERRYPSIEEAARRFRLRPPQPCDNAFILAHIARHSVKDVAGEYEFKLDSAVFAKMPADEHYPSGADMIRSLTVPHGLIYGELSRFYPTGCEPGLRELFGDYVIGIPDAHHHVFVDQPLAFIDALAGMLKMLKQRGDTGAQPR